jgi:two-component system nitrogen regulation response regulator NtrX
MSYVLVVEDDEAIRELVQTVLEDEGHDVQSARSGLEAMGMAMHEQPGLIITDLRLKQESGAAFIRDYRQLPDARARVVVISGVTGLREEATKLEADGFLAKPFSLDDLIDVVAELCPSAVSAAIFPT